MARSLQALLLLALLGGCRRPVPVTPPPPTARLAAEPAAVRLLVIDFETLDLTEASAFPVSADGLLATCAHVVAAGTPIGVVLPDGTRATVREVVAYDRDSDLALLRVEGEGYTPLRLAPGPAAAGQQLRAVTRDGNVTTPCLGTGEDAEVGAVTLFGAAGLGEGASGGALVDAAGRVVGVVRGGFEDGDREGVAVPVDRLAELLAGVPDAQEDDS